MTKLHQIIERLRGPVPSVVGEQLQSGAWLRAYARWLFVSTDAVLFLCSGVAVGVLADQFAEVEKQGEVILVALAVVGFAALAVVLTALAVFVSLVNDAYLRILSLSERGGLSGYLIPFLSAGFISSITTIFGAVGAVVYEAFSAESAKAVILGLEVGFVVWATWAVFQLVVEISVHGLNRYTLARDKKRADISDLVEVEEADDSTSTPPTP
jgi:hypothetical protein